MKTVIEMAIRAGLQSEYGVSEFAYTDRLEHFAQLVRADAIADEREACAKVCESQAGPELDFPDERSNAQDAMAFECAAIIRARSKDEK